MVMDKEKQESWSKRYKDRTDGLKPPALFIKDNLNQLKDGSVLDLASGDGRNSIFLAKSDFKVTAIDFSDQALKRLENFSHMEKVEVKKKVVDVENEVELLALGKFDNIIISKYKPNEKIFKMLPRLLNENGKIVFVTFNYKQAEATGFPRKYCLEENEFKSISDKLELIKLEVLEEHDNHFDGYIFKLK